MEGGNTSRIVVWLDDTVIVKKPLAGKMYYFIADARTGQPVPRADVELFGWRNVPTNRRNESRVETKTLSLKADDDGQLQVPTGQPYQWVITASTPEGRLAYQGFSYLWGTGRQRSS